MSALIWQQVNDIYQQELGRDADPGGHQNFYDALANGQMSIDDVRNAMRGSAEYQQKNASAPAAPAASPSAQNNSGYSIQSSYGESGNEYYLADSNGNRVANVVAQTDDYGNPSSYYIDNSYGGGESGGSASYTPVDLNTINEKATKGVVPFGAGMGPALGYAYGMKNSEGDIFRKFDAQGNLTEYLDQHGVFQKASDFKPEGLVFNASTGNFETSYVNPNSPRANITESNASSVNKYKEDQGGWLGEGGWKNIGMLALTGLTAGLGAAGGVGLAGAAGANAAESAAAINALINGGSTLGNALQIGNQLVNIGTTAYDFLKNSNPETAYVIERLQAETKKNEAKGMTREQAVEAAMGAIAQTTPPPTSSNVTQEPSFQGSNIVALPGSDAGAGGGGAGSGFGTGSGTAGGGSSGITDYLKDQEEKEKEKEENGNQAVNLLSQMAVGQVKTPPVAEIDYMYDIGGDSVFATPKQESLMPSPFEEAPEAVEGAMPRYQYQDPKGGYLYADGGMVAFDEGGFAGLERPEKKSAIARMVEPDTKVFEALAAYGSNPKKYEDIYNFYTNPNRPQADEVGKELPSGLSEMSKDYSGLDMSVLGLLHSAKQSGNPERFLESLAPYFDKKAKFDFTDRVGPKNYVMPIVAPNTANIGSKGRRGENDVRGNPTSNTFLHEMEHTLQNEARGYPSSVLNALTNDAFLSDMDKNVLKRSKEFVSTNPTIEKAMMFPADNAFDNPSEALANIAAVAQGMAVQGKDFLQTPEGQALFPTDADKNYFYNAVLPGVTSIRSDMGFFQPENRPSIKDESLARKAVRKLGFEDGGLIENEYTIDDLYRMLGSK